MRQAELFRQGPRLDRRAAETRAERAVTASEAIATKDGAEWISAAYEAARALAQGGRPFLSETILDAVGGPPEGVDARALGSVLRTLARQGVIRATGRFVPGASASRHGAPVREWEGVGVAH